MLEYAINTPQVQVRRRYFDTGRDAYGELLGNLVWMVGTMGLEPEPN
jgi:hypothetical protein